MSPDLENVCNPQKINRVRACFTIVKELAPFTINKKRASFSIIKISPTTRKSYNNIQTLNSSPRLPFRPLSSFLDTFAIKVVNGPCDARNDHR